MLVLVVATSALFATRTAPEAKLVRERHEYISWLEGEGGSVVFLAPSVAKDSQLSDARRELGDRLVDTLLLPYNYPGDVLRRRAELLFPEASTISVISAETALERVLGGPKALEAIRRPEIVEACRLATAAPSQLETRKLSDFPTQGNVVSVPPGIASAIGECLVNPDLYRWHMLVTCIPDYGVRVTFFRGTDRVDVLFCFECNLVLTFWNERQVQGAYFPGARSSVLAKIKELFPDDQAIQTLPETR